MRNSPHVIEILSPWWRHAVIIFMVVGFTILIWLSVRTYSDAPPIPSRVALTSGRTIFTGEDILSGQQVFLKYGLMENGSVWGHGAYLGPDFSAQYLHTLSIDVGETIARVSYGKDVRELNATEQQAVNAQVQRLLKENRYDPQSQTLTFSEGEALSYQRQLNRWTEYFSQPTNNAGLPAKYINDPKELQQLTAFFAWTAWASAVNRPGRSYSYTNNFPYDSSVGNTPTGDAVLWSALSLITLLAATALGLFAVGRFDYLGWKGKSEHIHPQMLPGVSSPSQKATVKYFVIVALLFLAQVLVGGGTAHYRAEPGSFYGIDLSRLFPSIILCTWHLQLAILWVATAYVAGGLFFAPSLGGDEPQGQVKGVNLLFGALVLVSVGSLFGELLGINQLLGNLWFWIGHQGWEYMVFVFRQVSSDVEWVRIEKYVRISFWGLNSGLALMVVTSLFPGGVLQLNDVLNNGYWHARSQEFLNQTVMRTIEWLRLPGDVVFIGVGVMPLLVAAGTTYRYLRRQPKAIAS